MSQKYGLILKKKNESTLPTRRPAIFDDLEDDEDDEQMELDLKPTKTVGPVKPDFLTLNAFDDSDDSQHESLAKKDQFASVKANKEAKLLVQKALEENPNVFAYDDFYDEDKQAKNKTKTQVQGKPKYIEGILRGAELRKIEEERRLDRKIEKERQAEGKEFDDKEAFVTKAYKQKLLERKVFDEKERLETELEERMDVRKQGDMSLFYQHQFKQQLGEEKVDTKNRREELLKKIAENLNERRKQEEGTQEQTLVFKKKSERTNRQRQKSESSEEEENVQVIKKRPLEPKMTKQKVQEHVEDAEPDRIEEDGKSDQDQMDEGDLLMSDDGEEKDAASTAQEHRQKDGQNMQPMKPKMSLREILLSLFEKKTVGEVFLDQQKKYFERLAARKAGV